MFGVKKTQCVDSKRDAKQKSKTKLDHISSQEPASSTDTNNLISENKSLNGIHVHNIEVENLNSTERGELLNDLLTSEELLFSLLFKDGSTSLRNIGAKSNKVRTKILSLLMISVF